VASLALHVWSGKVIVEDGTDKTAVGARHSLHRICRIGKPERGAAALKTVTVDWRPQAKGAMPITVRWGPGKSYCARSWASLATMAPGDRWIITDLAEQTKSLQSRPSLRTANYAAIRRMGLLEQGVSLSWVLGPRPVYQAHDPQGRLLASGPAPDVLAAVPEAERARVARGFGYMTGKCSGTPTGLITVSAIVLEPSFLSPLVGTAVHVHPRWRGKGMKFKHKIRMTPLSLLATVSAALGTRVTVDTSGYHIRPPKR
jgi:hypothetical protein